MPIEIKKFNAKNATDNEYVAYNKWSNRIRAERHPDDPPIPLEETIQSFKNIPDFIEVVFWIAWKEGGMELAALGETILPFEDNLHLAHFDIGVLLEFRRQGLGKALLSKIVDAAKQEKRRLLITNTVARIPAGEAFMECVGAERSLESHINQLTIAELDPSLIQQWLERASEQKRDFEIGIWQSTYPEEYLDAIVELHSLFNEQPFGDLEMEDFNISAENIRQVEKSIFARGFERWTVFLREKQTGSFAGYTEVLWNSTRPEIVYQEITGVFPRYRNKGLGRWLKATMLEKILQEQPEAKFIRTQNADMNAPMMKINNELGFKPYISECAWQMSTDRVAEYLNQ